ncbi:MAG: response regulator [Anaerolineaceae bacterium]|nr:MAG: response regulator [Anaerolineaceae bacterium]
MSGGRKPTQDQQEDVITILLVDDIREVRENIGKLLAFEADLKVVGNAETGRQGVQMAKELQPDVIIMDINMPDMDGLQATNIITKQVPTAAVIIMSVQNDPDYMRQALRAGARDFLGKSASMDDLYNTIRAVYRNHEQVRRQYAAMEQGVMEKIRNVGEPGETVGDRAGHVIAVYSPQGGTGKTTIATSLASALMREDVRVLLIDASLQFSDVGTFLNLKSQSSVVEVAQDVDDIDLELFENIVTTHDSGLKVLLGPPRPEAADPVVARPDTMGRIIEQVRNLYDFVIVDTSTRLDEMQLGIFDQASRILLVGTPTLVSVKNMRLVLDIFDKLDYEQGKTGIVLSKVVEDRRKRIPTVPVERVEGYLKVKVLAQIPAVDDRTYLSAVNKGVPLIAAERNPDRPPARQFYELATRLYNELMEIDEEEAEAIAQQKAEKQTKQKKGGLLTALFGR